MTEPDIHGGEWSGLSVLVRHRECVFFSPHCIKPDEGLFGRQAS